MSPDVALASSPAGTTALDLFGRLWAAGGSDDALCYSIVIPAARAPRGRRLAAPLSDDALRDRLWCCEIVLMGGAAFPTLAEGELQGCGIRCVNPCEPATPAWARLGG